jgi:RNA polymerase sigma factor (sigma-70 family)
MTAPSLHALQQGDPGAWDQAFSWLFPTALHAAQAKLQPFLPEEVEDVAMEALEVMVEKVRQGEVRSIEDLRPLAFAVARNKAVSLLRERFAGKRGEGRTASLTAPQTEEVDCPDPLAESPLDALEHAELAERLRRTLAELKPPQGAILTDRFLNGLSYEEIAKRHGVAVGGVGVFLSRGLKTLRGIWGRDRE